MLITGQKWVNKTLVHRWKVTQQTIRVAGGRFEIATVRAASGPKYVGLRANPWFSQCADGRAGCVAKSAGERTGAIRILFSEKVIPSFL